MKSTRSKAGSSVLAGLLCATLLGTGLLVPVSARAMGDDTTPTCKPGEVYDKKTRQCVKQSGANLSDDNIADYAYSLAKAERYQEALDILATARNQDSPVVLNYRGYATRKLGRVRRGHRLLPEVWWRPTRPMSRSGNISGKPTCSRDAPIWRGSSWRRSVRSAAPDARSTATWKRPSPRRPGADATGGSAFHPMREALPPSCPVTGKADDGYRRERL
ncbi:hypothetical protein [Azospirillum sp. B506]|uniref:hypothetical protein n=1 Tax=Azospirillum sp. B506 TaxID=137721 RepID=UPI0019019B2F|nr:hypothetical protein [Azospirillum sp. B506]